MKNNKVSELHMISERFEEIVRDYSNLIGDWPSASQQAFLQHLQVTEKMIKEQIQLLEEYERISMDDIIDFTVDIPKK